ncbi:hypothetical protein Leryth_023086 [Lithospermum erythrorhizon]|nr:hypothetical protein Leryth_023086 [Lithospermum erythrorhizon]
MHEYTLDEQELKRCPVLHDYYALYKVFKKSGPGPKNGEQYGAPFREEDWAEEDCFDQEGAVTKGDIVPVNNKESQAPVEHPTIDWEEFLNRIADEAVLLQSPDVNHEYALGQLLDEQELHKTLVNNCSREVIAVEQINMPQTLCHNYDVQASFDLTQSGTSQLHFNEAPEITSGPNAADGLQLQVIEEDFLEDFLEMDDLVGAQSTAQDFDHGNRMNFQLDEFDGLSELDLFQEAGLFLNESCFDDQAHISQSLIAESERNPDEPNLFTDHYTNHLEVGSADPEHMYHLDGNDRQSLSSDSRSHLNNFVNEMVSHQPSQLDGSNQLCDQQYSIFAPPEANDRVNPSITSGMICDVASGSNPTGLSQNQNVKPHDASGSWFSSALWDFVDSIPSAPAYAAETALVNKTLEKMSSFSRLRITSKNMNYAAGNTPPDSKSGNSKNRILLSFFIVGTLCAILFLFIGTPSEGLSRFIFS